MGKYDVDQIRRKMKAKKGFVRDPNEFRPPRAQDGQELKYRFFILPPLEEGDKCADGVASRSMEGLFYVENGSHWINNRPYPCPRIHDGEECPLCEFGFNLMSETSDRAKRSQIARAWLARAFYAVNIYFPPDEVNPEDVAGRVMWYNAPKQVFDIWEQCIYTDDPGDPHDPQPYGVFYDEENAYLFQLVVRKRGEWNDYMASKFLVSCKRPIVTLSNGKPDRAAIDKILASRFDLFTKFAPRDVDGLRKLCDQIVSGGDSGFDEDDVVSVATVAHESKPKARPVETDASEPEPEPEPEVEAAPEPEPESEPQAEPEPRPEPAESDNVDDGVDADEIQDLLRQLEENAD